MFALFVDVAEGDGDGMSSKKKSSSLPLSLYDSKVAYLPLPDCKHGWLYEIMSRNLTLGVFRKDRKGFVGIREKLGHVYLFVEYHWDTGEPFGTVKPLRRVERCPIKELDEFFRTEDGKLKDNEKLFDWLKRKQHGAIQQDNKKATAIMLPKRKMKPRMTRLLLRTSARINTP